RERWRFLLAGGLAAWTASCELPAGLLVMVGLVLCAAVDLKRTALYFVPPLVVVTAAFFATNIASVGTYIPAYMQRGLYANSYWDGKNANIAKSAVDSLNDDPESHLVYFLNLTVGHHGWFSLTPIWLLAGVGLWNNLRRKDPRLAGAAWPILFISAGVFCFYWLVSDQRNYGGHCHGARWLLWLSALWLLMLPMGVDAVAKSARGRAFAWCCLAVSVFSTADAFYSPWTRSWLQRIFLHYGVINY
ncbi:MAG: hypothetical protein ACRC1K_24430, partial [Planctomycetia bacterium]